MLILFRPLAVDVWQWNYSFHVFKETWPNSSGKLIAWGVGAAYGCWYSVRACLSISLDSAPIVHTYVIWTGVKDAPAAAAAATARRATLALLGELVGASFMTAFFLRSVSM